MIDNSRKMSGAYDPEDVHLLAGGGGGGVVSTFKSYFRVQAKPLERLSIGHFHDGVIYYYYQNSFISFSFFNSST